jgi:Ca-activated chloride channel family protein
MAAVLPEHRKRSLPMEVASHPIPVHSMRILALIIAVAVLFVSLAPAQRPREQKPASTTPPDNRAEPPQDEVETLKIDTNLVTVPVIASSRNGMYISDLRKEEFNLSEDGVAQQIAFLATVNAPFHLVLMLDTSASTEEKIGMIQRAAMNFVEQLSSADQVKVVSFDSEVRDLNEFTSDKSILRGVIQRTRSGTGTRLYDAMQLSLNALRPINQRKAIVIFTDGVDWHSESATFDDTIHNLDESGVIVYPIRFDTRSETERIARQQQGEQSGIPLPTSSVIRQPPSGTTPTTFPSEEESPIKSSRPRSTLPIEDILNRRRNPNPPPDPRNDPFPDGRGGSPTARDRRPPNTGPNTPSERRNDGISGMLDQAYLMADSYLQTLAERSGGRVYRADTVVLLPDAFAAIAAELRTQYLLGYYPTNRVHNGTYRKIQVKTSRKDIAIRARPGYRAKSGG